MGRSDFGVVTPHKVRPPEGIHDSMSDTGVVDQPKVLESALRGEPAEKGDLNTKG